MNVNVINNIKYLFLHFFIAYYTLSTRKVYIFHNVKAVQFILHKKYRKYVQIIVYIIITNNNVQNVSKFFTKILWEPCS